jgi:hypothetical protein
MAGPMISLDVSAGGLPRWANKSPQKSGSDNPDKRKWRLNRVMSALVPIADISRASRHVRYVPKAEVVEGLSRTISLSNSQQSVAAERRSLITDVEGAGGCPCRKRAMRWFLSDRSSYTPSLLQILGLAQLIARKEPPFYAVSSEKISDGHHGCPPSPDACGRLNVVTPFHHLSGDSRINCSLRAGPITASSHVNLKFAAECLLRPVAEAFN